MLDAKDARDAKNIQNTADNILGVEKVVAYVGRQ